jgi:hypothetical protein
MVPDLKGFKIHKGSQEMSVNITCIKCVRCQEKNAKKRKVLCQHKEAKIYSHL